MYVRTYYNRKMRENFFQELAESKRETVSFLQLESKMMMIQSLLRTTIDSLSLL